MIKYLSNILVLALLLTGGCRSFPPSCDSTNASDEIEFEGNYEYMNYLISSLPSGEHESWISVFSAVNKPDIPSEYSGNCEAYNDGFRSGYAYFVVTQSTILESFLQESTEAHTAFVEGWYEGQSDAFYELLKNNLLSNNQKEISSGGNSMK